MLKDRISSIPKSASLDSLNIQSTLETTILSSTKNQEKSTKYSNSNGGRLTMLPTSHKSKNENSELMNSKKDQSSQEYDKSTEPNSLNKIEDLNHDSNNDTTPKRVVRISSPLNKNSKDENEIHHQKHVDENTNDDGFDSFILENFNPFSGKQNVIQWLDDVERKFNQCRIGRNLRFKAIPLLVEEEAKRQYLKNKKEIQSFDDFYEFLLSEFEPSNKTSRSFKFHETVNNQSADLTQSYQAKLTSESSQSVSNDNNSSASKSDGVKPTVNSTTFSGSSSISENDQTLSDLRKAIVGDFIKNPKTFKGNKDDVNKWIDDIEHLFNVAHMSDSIRLDLISYSLRGDALEWYKNNRSLFSSWQTFVSELKRAFTSSFCGELAFKKLESYTQGENQSIRSFFNEVLKLCKEADITMSEATKLKTLLNKTKSSIQFEVRKKKPTSTSEFLEYAKEAEELLQLSNVNTSTSSTTNHNANSTSQTFISAPAPLLPARQSFENSTNNNSDRSMRRFNNTYRSSNFRSNYYQPNNTYSYPQYPRNTYTTNQNFSRGNQQRTTNNSGQASRLQLSSSQTQATNNNSSRRNIVNAIDLPSSSENSESLQDMYSSNACAQCSQFGHEASACPNF